MKIGTMQKKHITNKEFEAAIKDENFIKIAKSIFKKFGKVRWTADDKREIYLDALWYSLTNWDETKSIFTTYFYNNIRYKILTFVDKNKLKELTNFNLSRILGKEKHQDDNLDNIIGGLHDKYKTPIMQKFVLGMSAKEIGSENGYSRDYALKLIKKGIRLLKRGV